MGPTALLDEDFFALKNPTASAGFEPANLGTKGQHATSRPPKPLSLVVFLRTVKFNIQKFYVVLALRWVFCTNLRTDKDFVLYVINWLVFITVVESVYCAVQADSLYKVDYV